MRIIEQQQGEQKQEKKVGENLTINGGVSTQGINFNLSKTVTKDYRVE
jgi:hypothetical protein